MPWHRLHAHDPGRRLLVPLKNNLAADDQGLAFRIESVTISQGTAPRLIFENEPVTISADEALSTASGPGRRSVEKNAEAFLRQYLAAGAVPALDVEAAARAEGISLISVRRAKKALGVLSKKAGVANEWRWVLPTDTKATNAIEGAHSNQVITFAQNDHFGEQAETTERPPDEASADEASNRVEGGALWTRS